MWRYFIFMLVSLTGSCSFVSAQPAAAAVIDEMDVRKIIDYLASDSLKGRGNGRPELLQAGMFIGDEFKKYGLKPLPGRISYYLPFRPFGGSRKIVSDNLEWNGKKMSSDEFMYFHPVPGNYTPKNLEDFTVIKIDSFFTQDILEKYRDVKTDLLLWSNRPQPDMENYFPPLIDIPSGGLSSNILLVCTRQPPTRVALSGVANYYSNLQYNVVAMLPGRSKPNEIVAFSAHYDHEGVFKRGRKKDSIMNGANDNASGTTALMMLARYYAQVADNERTLLFCAFSGEELGLLGSKAFVEEIETDSIVANINIEMIAIPQYGRNDIFITGPAESELPAILEKNLRKHQMRVKPGPSEEKLLYRRSDNFSFAKKGVPAHSIMSSDDDDKCYHQPCDDLDRVDIAHMTAVIKGIIVATKTLVSGEETPKRIAKKREE